MEESCHAERSGEKRKAGRKRPMNQQDPSSFPSAEAFWATQFQEMCAHISPCFRRSETRNRARAYLQGLLSPIEGKNGWQLAEEAGESTPYAMQYLLVGQLPSPVRL